MKRLYCIALLLFTTMLLPAYSEEALDPLSDQRLVTGIRGQQYLYQTRIEDARKELDYYRGLEEILKKTAAEPEKYTKECIRTIFQAISGSKLQQNVTADLLGFTVKYNPSIKKYVHETTITVQAKLEGGRDQQFIVPLFSDTLKAQLQALGFTVNSSGGTLTLTQVLRVASQRAPFLGSMKSQRVGGHLSLRTSDGSVAGSWNNSMAAAHIDIKTATGNAAMLAAKAAAGHISRLILEKYLNDELR
ncbi:MAG TPA: hypothetical protein PK253_14150 [Spirochaetota bacterium]|nr:hypothetical protein [Spirochaetota bacterium]